MGEKAAQENDTVKAAGLDFAKTTAPVVRSLASTFSDTQEAFAKELKAICGDEERKMVQAYLAKTAKFLEDKPKKKPQKAKGKEGKGSLKAVK